MKNTNVKMTFFKLLPYLALLFYISRLDFQNLIWIDYLIFILLTIAIGLRILNQFLLSKNHNSKGK